MLKTVCPHCNKRLKYQEGLEGGTYECPKCLHGVTLAATPGVRGIRRRKGPKLKRLLLWAVICLVIVGGAFLVYQRIQENAHQRQRDSHRILVQ